MTPIDADYMEELAGPEIVHWYERPGWPLGDITPAVALSSAFALGALVGAGVLLAVGRLHRH